MSCPRFEQIVERIGKIGRYCGFGVNLEVGSRIVIEPSDDRVITIEIDRFDNFLRCRRDRQVKRRYRLMEIRSWAQSQLVRREGDWLRVGIIDGMVDLIDTHDFTLVSIVKKLSLISCETPLSRLWVSSKN